MQNRTANQVDNRHNAHGVAAPTFSGLLLGLLLLIGSPGARGRDCC